MNDILLKIAKAVEFGKVNKSTPYPPSMKDQDGVDELVKAALEEGISAENILSDTLIFGMKNIGVKFRENKVFVPEVLMAARAMTAGMNHLRPYFQSGEVQRKGTFIIGTVHGDLHDIGKKIAAMMIEGAGWEVIDLGANVPNANFIEALEANPCSIVGLSALLTTTMVNMDKAVKEIKDKFPGTTIMVGGAPVNKSFCDEIGADFYSPDPHGAVEYLENNFSK